MRFKNRVLALLLSFVMVLSLNSMAFAQEKSTESSSMPTFTVKVDEAIEHGTVKADKENNIKEGELVTLTVQPDSGYELETLSVKDKDENDVKLEETEELSFKMPASDTVVNAVFKQQPAADDESVTDEETASGTGGEEASVPSENRLNIALASDVTLAADAEEKTLKVNVNWNGDSGYEDLRPKNITATVNNGTVSSKVTVSSDNNWETATDMALDDGAGNAYAFTTDSTELNTKLYKVNGSKYENGVLTLNCDLNAIQRGVKLNIYNYLSGTSSYEWLSATPWEYAKNRNVTIPQYVKLTLLSNGQKAEETEPVIFSRDSKSDWGKSPYTCAWWFPKSDENGNTINYGEMEVKIETDLGDGLPLEYSVDEKELKFSSSNYSRINTVNARLTGIVYESISFTWNDDENAAGTRPKYLSTTLYADDKQVGETHSLSIPSDGNISFSDMPVDWRNLPQKDSEGNLIKYTLKFNDLPEYYSVDLKTSPEYTDDKGYSTNCVTTLSFKPVFTLKRQSAKATVYWEGAGIGSDNELANRPTEEVLKLYYTSDDGNTWKEYNGSTGFTIKPGTDPNEWTFEWSALPAVDKEGNPVKYKAEQLGLPSIYSTSTDEPLYVTDDDGNVISTEFKFHNSYNDNWNYKIDLRWNTKNTDEKYAINRVTVENDSLIAQYQLSISVQKPYEAGKLEVRIPYELFKGRNGGKGTTVKRFSVGDKDNPSLNYSFTYYIDDKGTPNDTSDDEVVFYNYKDLAASDNCQLTVEYEFYPSNVVDCSVGSLTANASGQYKGQVSVEKQQSGPITYRLDTGVKEASVSKKPFQLVYSWPEQYGQEPEDFDITKYNYVIYQLYCGYTNSNQPTTLIYTDKPGEGGEVCRVAGSNSTNFSYGYETELETNASGEGIWKEEYNSYANKSPRYYYVLVRYPRTGQKDPLDPDKTIYETDYHNTVTLNAIAKDKHEGDKEDNDYNDVISTGSNAAIHWEDYTFKYEGSVYSRTKYMYDFKSGYYGSLTYLESGSPQTAPFYTIMTVNGYNLTNGYRMEITDDAVCACAYINGNQTDYVRLNEGDYYLSGTPSIDIKCTSVDRTNGKEIMGEIPDKPFSFYGRKGNTGEWELLGQFTMQKKGDNDYQRSYTATGDLTGLGYTAFKLVSPDGLKDQFRIEVDSEITIDPESEVFKDWFKNGSDLTRVQVTNIAAFDIYAADDNGDYKWINPGDSSNDSYSDKIGLSEQDKAEFGAYRERSSSTSQMAPLKMYSTMKKKVENIAYDVTNEIVSVKFSLNEYEEARQAIPDENLLKSKCQNGGTFYDLLPRGFVYDASKEIIVRGGRSTYSYDGSQPAAVKAVRIISDDYKGTGRQMIAFDVESLLPEGENWFENKETGFYLTFYAKAGYNDVSSGATQYNTAAFQRDDLASIEGSAANVETGRPSYNVNENAYPVDENGNNILYDINGDGVVNEDKNTMYSYTQFISSQLQTIENGLSKKVRGASGIYQKEDVTDLSGTYSYKLKLTTQKNGTTSNVILYDILENAANTGGATGESEGWKGKLKSVNANAVKSLGVNPVVYYSTRSNLTYNDPDNFLLENAPDIWSTTQPDDLSTVTAIAIDLRYAKDGSEFVFDAEQSAEAEIYMTAPDKLQTSEFAYNRPAYNATFKADNAADSITSFNIAERTKISLRDLQDFSFVKQFVKEDGSIASLPGVTFKIYKCSNTDAGHEHNGKPGDNGSCWGKNPILTTSSGMDGTVSFTNLDTGTYAVIESRTRDGFELIRDNYWTVEVDAKAGTISAPKTVKLGDNQKDMVWNEASDEKAGYYSLLNDRTVRKVGIGKYWHEDNDKVLRPSSLTFDLYRNGELYDTKTVDIPKTGVDHRFGVIFSKTLYKYDDNGKLYDYKVVERIPDGYEEENNGEYKIEYQNYIGFENNRLGILDVKKLVTGNAADAAQKFDFTVTLTNADGTPVAAVDANGNPVTYKARRFTTDPNTYAEEILTLGDGGKLSFKLSDKETLRIIGLPVGVTWKAEEAAVDNCTTTVEPGTASGMASSRDIGSVVFTNDINTYGDLVVTKKIAGNAASSDKEFNFTVTLSDNTISGTYGDMEFTDGVADFTLKGGESKKAEGLPNKVSYTVTEDDYSADGYVTTKTGDTGEIVGNEAVKAEFTNTRNADGSLTISKTLEGNDVDTDKEFTFTVELSDKTINGTYSDVEFTDGVGNITLKGGESKTIEGLPNRTEYKVTESDNDGYECSAPDGITGVIDENTPAVAAFTNTRNTYGDLIVTKKIEGNAASADKEFNFTVTLSDNVISGTYGDMEFTDGVASFTLKGGESKKAEGLPNGVSYTVTEDDYSADGYVTTKTGDTGDIIGNETAKAEFTNTRNADGSLTISKTLEGNDVDTNKEFTFTVELSDKTINGTYSDVEFTDGVGSLTLKGGESRTIEGLPNRTEYKVTESDNDGYECSAPDGITGVIDENAPAVAAFTNTRNTYGALIVAKKIAGNAASADKAFNFKVTLSDNRISGTYGDMEFTDGVASFTLKGGESKKAEGLPNRVSYTVTEDDYSAEGYVTTKTGDTGDVVGNEAGKAEFTNTKNEVKPTETPDKPQKPQDENKPQTPQKSDKGSENIKAPGTGDSSHMVLWGVILGAAVIAIAVVLIVRKKKNK